jgi:hypothetical protein
VAVTDHPVRGAGARDYRVGTAKEVNTMSKAHRVIIINN